MRDGFGDKLSPAELIPLLRTMARERVPEERVDDAIQEALVTVWKVADTKPDATPSYLRGAARLRIKDYAVRDNPTGAPSRQGKHEVKPDESIDGMESPAMLLAAVDIIDTVVMAYHQGEIYAAIRALPPSHRAYVHMRFWEGMNHTEIAARWQVPVSRVEDLWRTAKPKLKKSLAHLG